MAKQGKKRAKPKKTEASPPQQPKYPLNTSGISNTHVQGTQIVRDA
jgi:hypothetical protein